MSDEISLPIDQMRQVARQIVSDTDSLRGETSSRIQQLHNTNSSLPASMQSSLGNLLDPLQRNLAQVLTLRQDIGETLAAASGISLQTEEAIDISMMAQ